MLYLGNTNSACQTATCWALFIDILLVATILCVGCAVSAKDLLCQLLCLALLAICCASVLVLRLGQTRILHTPLNHLVEREGDLFIVRHDRFTFD